jgi:hypothetical protein
MPPKAAISTRNKKTKIKSSIMRANSKDKKKEKNSQGRILGITKEK